MARSREEDGGDWRRRPQVGLWRGQVSSSHHPWVAKPPAALSSRFSATPALLPVMGCYLFVSPHDMMSTQRASAAFENPFLEHASCQQGAGSQLTSIK